LNGADASLHNCAAKRARKRLVATASRCKRIYKRTGNVVSVKYNGNEYYYVRNGQDDIVKLIDSTGTPVIYYIYDTWGKKVTTTGSLAGSLGLIQPFRYRGYVYDFETGFYYLQSRYYDPTTGRFISSDVLLSTGQGVLGHNAYYYEEITYTNHTKNFKTLHEFLYKH